MELIFIVIVIIGIFYVISKNDKGAVISSNSISSSNYVNCRICKDRLSESTHKYELTNQDGDSKTILCDSCYVTFKNENPQFFQQAPSPNVKVKQPQKANDDPSLKDVLEYLDSAANSRQPVRIVYHGEKDSRERMIQPIDVRDEFDPSESRRQYVCLEENIVKNFLPSKMEIITEDGEVFGLGKPHKVKHYSTIFQVRDEIVRLRPELEDFIDISETHLQFKIIGKRGKFLKYPRFGLEYADHRKKRPWASQIPETTSYYKHLDKAANYLIQNISQFDVQRDFHS